MRTVTIATCAAVLLLAAACGNGDDDNGSGSKSGSDYSATEKRMVAGLNALTDSIEGEDDCNGGKVAGRTVEEVDQATQKTELWRPLTTEWFGPKQVDAPGERPKFVGTVSFCAPIDGESARYAVDVIGFNSSGDARKWFDELASGATEGLPVVSNSNIRSETTQPPSDPEKCDPVAKKAGESYAGKDIDGKAMDVVLERACQANAPKGPFDWAPDRYTMATVGPWVISVQVRQSEGQAEWTDPGGRATMRATKRMWVAKDAQKESAHTLASDLKNP